MLKVLPKETASMLTRDRVRLDADIYRPERGGKYPVLLMRQPYGRAIASTVVYAHPNWYAGHGYIVVIQDVRGRGTSEGEFLPFQKEMSDGYDTINWAASLPGSTGVVGMYGFSYQGMTQLYAAASHPPALKTICPAMVGYDLYADWIYEGGAFCLQGNLGWAVQLAAETARLKGDEIAYQILYGASRNLPFHYPSNRFSETLRRYAPFYHEWLKHPYPDAYWQQLAPPIQDVNLPMLHIGGWFDTYLRGTLGFYQEMVARKVADRHLLIGPWGHLPWGRKVGAIDYGPAAVSPVDRIQVKWFDRVLKGKDTDSIPPVYLFEMGSNQWRSLPTWPQNNPQSYFLSSTGSASISEGAIIAETPANEMSDLLVHDPWRPVPALGGHAVAPAGSFDRSSIDCRADVLTYSSAPLEEDLYLIGNVIVEIYCTADAPSYDLCAILSEVKPDGRVYNFTQGYVRVKDDRTPVALKLQATCMHIAKGNALRLSLSAACFPAYPVNPGTGATAGETSIMDAQIITITVRSGGDRSSRLLLPVSS